MYLPAPKKAPKKKGLFDTVRAQLQPRAAPRVTPPKSVVARTKAIRQLQAYQYGAYDTVEGGTAFQKQLDRFSALDAELANDGVLYDDAQYTAGGLGRDAKRRVARRRRGPNQFGAPISLPGGVKLTLKGSPRVFGKNGPLVSTVNDLRYRAERGDLSAIDTMDKARKVGPKGIPEWGRIWKEMLPTWNLPDAVRARVRALDGLPALPVAVQPGQPAVQPPAPELPPPPVVMPPPVLPPSYQPPSGYLPPPPGYQPPPSYEPPSAIEPYIPPPLPAEPGAPAGAAPKTDVQKLLVPAAIAAALLFM